MLLGIRWKSMRLKIIAWSFVPAAIILGAVALVIFIAYQQVTESLVLERDQDLTRLAAGQLTTGLREYNTTLAALARTADIYRADPVVQQAALERTRSRLAPFDGGVLILNTFGTLVAAEPQRPDALGADWSDRPYFQQVSQASGPVLSDIVEDGPEGRPVIALAVPITDEQGEFRGSIVGLFHLGASATSPLSQSIARLRLGESGQVYLVDSQGRLIYHPEVARVGESIANQEIVQDVLAGKVGSIRTRNFSGQDIVAAFAPVPETPWGLVTEEEWSTLFEASQGYRLFLLFLLALGIIVPALVVTAGVRRLTEPVHELIRASKAVAAGNFGQTITVNTGDELEELAKQFNSMSAQLQRSYAIMEQRVAGQTQALSTINAITAVVSRSLDLEEILQDALDKTLEITEMEAGGAFRLNEAGQSLSLMAHRGLSPVLVNYLARLPLTAEATAQAAGLNLPAVRRVADYPPGEWRDLLTGEEWRLVVSIPLTAKGRFLGTINLFSGTSRAPVMEHLSLLSTIGQQIGVAVENAELYEQAQQLAAAEERQRLARDLHDSVTQAIYAVTLYAEAANRLLTTGETALASQHLTDLRLTAQDALRELRLLIYELRPPILEEEGLVTALRTRLESVEERSGLKTVFTVEGLDGSFRLPLDLETGLYRIAQEALNNILKHAQAREVGVCLQYLPAEDRIVLEVADDGQGFEMSNGAGKGRLGLQTMRERANLLGGELVITSQPGAGTRIRVEVEHERNH